MEIAVVNGPEESPYQLAPFPAPSRYRGLSSWPCAIEACVSASRFDNSGAATGVPTGGVTYGWFQPASLNSSRCHNGNESIWSSLIWMIPAPLVTSSATADVPLEPLLGAMIDPPPPLPQESAATTTISSMITNHALMHQFASVRIDSYLIKIVK